jgi:hypothetical protein
MRARTGCVAVPSTPLRRRKSDGGSSRAGARRVRRAQQKALRFACESEWTRVGGGSPASGHVSPRVRAAAAESLPRHFFAAIRATAKGHAPQMRALRTRLPDTPRGSSRLHPVSGIQPLRSLTKTCHARGSWRWIERLRTASPSTPKAADCAGQAVGRGQHCLLLGSAARAARRAAPTRLSRDSGWNLRCQ